MQMPRRKITSTDELKATASDLPDLTDQQQRFVEGILAGKTASDAYRAAYDTSDMLDRSVHALACRLSANVNVRSWLDAARCAGFGRASCTFDEHLSELTRLRNLAEKTGNIGAAVQAEQIRGKVAGHHIDKVQDVTEQFDPTRTLQDIARTNPDLAASLAAEHGIEWSTSEGVTKH
jgi:hypothetical protein